jgi:tetratricopeptide (TPR) repeat protein
VRPRVVGLVLAAFVLTFVSLGIYSAARKSATFDEPLHLVAGYAALAHGDYRVDPTHPPFARLWATLPWLGMDGPRLDRGVIDQASPSDWLPQGVAFSSRVLYSNPAADRLLLAGRAMMLVWGVVLGLLLFNWTREWLGFRFGVLALCFYTVSPNIAAHTSLVTTDPAVTCFIFGAVYFLWRTNREATAVNVGGLVVCCALAAVTKFSGLLLAPILGALLVLCVLRSSMRLATAAFLAVAIVVAAVGVIWAAYGFHFSPSDSPLWLFQPLPSPIGFQPVIDWIDAHHLLPNAFSQGLSISLAASRTQAAYLVGQYSSTGWWYYFPLAFLFKTPVAVLLLLAAGFYACIARVRRLGLTNELFAVIPIAIFMAFAMRSGINIGIRHILPIYPFVILIAAAGTAEITTAMGRPGRIAVAALTAFCCVQFASVFPNTLTFFNVLVGGPRQGIRYLADSNIDWGQHLKLLKDWMEEKGVDHINLAYFGTADPAYYGLTCTYLPGTPELNGIRIRKPVLPGYVAISVNMLSGQYLRPEWRMYYEGFRDLAPVVDLGHSIRVYWVERWPEPASDQDDPPRTPQDIETERALARGLLSLAAYDHAIIHYRQYLKARPNNATALANLGVALIKAGSQTEGIGLLERASTLDPANARIRTDLILALLTGGYASRAAPYAAEAVRMTPGDPGAHYLLGMVQLESGNVDEATRQFGLSLEIDPGFRPALDALQALGRVWR